MTSIALHFRLDPDRPDEARAWEILRDWQNAGWDAQKIMVTALLGLQSQPIPSANPLDMSILLSELEGWARTLAQEHHQDLAELHTRLNELQAALEQWAAHPPTLPSPPKQDAPQQAETPAEAGLTDDFVASLKKIKKPGVRLAD